MWLTAIETARQYDCKVLIEQAISGIEVGCAVLGNGADLKSRYYPNISRAAMIKRGYVARKSSHTRGSAIDLTLFRLDTGEFVPMGSCFDFMDERPHHGARGIGGEDAQNHQRLRSIMENSGFEAFEYEWWHYVFEERAIPGRLF